MALVNHNPYVAPNMNKGAFEVMHKVKKTIESDDRAEERRQAALERRYRRAVARGDIADRGEDWDA